MVLKRIREEREAAAEDGVAGRAWAELTEEQLPACLSERGAALNPKAYSLRSRHPFADSSRETHGHFAENQFRLPPYSLQAIPFRWTRKEDAQAIANSMALPFDLAREPELAFETVWINDFDNQQIMLDTFFGALKTAPEAREVLDLIVALYRVERDAADRDLLGTEAHRMLRQEVSKPLVDRIDAWVDARLDTAVPKSPLGAALSFSHNQRQALRRFLRDPKIPLDNNIAERALRVVAVGRKNYLFVGHAEGGHNLAVLQTLCHTCLLHGVNPYEYIQDVLVRTGRHPASRIDELLPQSWAPAP